MSPEDFRAILSAARGGDERAFAQLWRRFNAPVERYLRVVASSPDIEDLASITWIEVARGLDRFEGGENEFRAWIFTIARMRLLDQRRRESRRVRTVGSDEPLEIEDTNADPELLTEAAAATEAALDLIRRLPPDQAEIVALRVIGGFDVAEVAEMTGKKPGTVRVTTHRALKRLAAHLAPDGTVLDVPGDAQPPGDVTRNESGPDGA